MMRLRPRFSQGSKSEAGIVSLTILQRVIVKSTLFFFWLLHHSILNSGILTFIKVLINHEKSNISTENTTENPKT